MEATALFMAHCSASCHVITFRMDQMESWIFTLSMQFHAARDQFRVSKKGTATACMSQLNRSAVFNLRSV
jgi:hypothetical protein